ncbi:MAG: aminotransferase class V-fold PLP-dependent enzyme [Bacteroidia bacterium]|nr:aminotransferase class V-fold PLP-dependent enzyme [Bacteroidia bacterium]NNF82640.1 aminotransferase class V-fold PLP-dependent enzyme [Flavobacteriaceae bacterium]NNK70216.1 aminotransferase class V-fold PLP-dependent enzyme [Flavobacteriaceae bacterium]
MSKLTDQIKALQEVSSELEPSEKRRQEYLTQVGQYAGEFISQLDEKVTFSNEKATPDAMALKPHKQSLSDLLDLYDREVAAKGIKPASGGHLGYIPGGGIYTSAIADYLVDVTNEYVGINYSCPAGVAIEHELLDWMMDIFGYPRSSVGNLASGGSIANLIALTAARDKHGIKNEKIRNSVIYLSPQVHHCINKALKIIGLEDVQIRYVELDSFHRIDTSDLEGKIKIDKKEGLHPFLIIASAGTTDTGAIDPMDRIADLAEEHNLWLHIDAAYGGYFVLVDSVKEKFKGIERSDSLVVDPHKGLFLPYGLGAVLVKDKEAVYHSHVYRANYMQDAVAEESPVHPADVSPELTKHFRSLRMWLPLQLHGIEPFKACLEEKLLLTRYFREGLLKLGFKLGPEPDLSVSYFWYPAEDENTFNRALLKSIHEDGRVFLSSTVIDGKFVIRMAILAFRTKLETIDKALNMVETHLKDLLSKH